MSENLYNEFPPVQLSDIRDVIETLEKCCQRLEELRKIQQAHEKRWWKQPASDRLNPYSIKEFIKILLDFREV